MPFESAIIERYRLRESNTEALIEYIIPDEKGRVQLGQPLTWLREHDLDGLKRIINDKCLENGDAGGCEQSAPAGVKYQNHTVRF